MAMKGFYVKAERTTVPWFRNGVRNIRRSPYNLRYQKDHHENLVQSLRKRSCVPGAGNEPWLQETQGGKHFI